MRAITRALLGRAPRGVSGADGIFPMMPLERERQRAREQNVNQTHAASCEHGDASLHLFSNPWKFYAISCRASWTVSTSSPCRPIRFAATRVRSTSPPHHRNTIARPGHVIPSRGFTHLFSLIPRVPDPLRQFGADRIARSTRHQPPRPVLREELIRARPVHPIARRRAHRHAFAHPYSRIAHAALQRRPTRLGIARRTRSAACAPRARAPRPSVPSRSTSTRDGRRRTSSPTPSRVFVRVARTAAWRSLLAHVAPSAASRFSPSHHHRTPSPIAIATRARVDARRAREARIARETRARARRARETARRRRDARAASVSAADRRAAHERARADAARARRDARTRGRGRARARAGATGARARARDGTTRRGTTSRRRGRCERSTRAR